MLNSGKIKVNAVTLDCQEVPGLPKIIRYEVYVPEIIPRCFLDKNICSKYN